MPGDGAMLLAAGMTVYLTAVMLYRRRRIVEQAGYMRIYRVELALCACLHALALDARFGLEVLLPSKWLAWMVRAASLGVLLPACVLAAMVLRRLGDVPSGQSENIIVPGLALENGRPTPELISRLDAARGYAMAHPQATLIVTGGNGGYGAASEARVMGDWLLSKGIDAARIRIEDRSTDTITNFRNAALMIDTAAPVLLVTSGYHMLRASALAHGSGFGNVQCLSTWCEWVFLPANIVWEVICLANNLIVGRISLRNMCK